jgi:iron complex outermembrane receptor protein
MGFCRFSLGDRARIIRMTWQASIVAAGVLLAAPVLAISDSAPFNISAQPLPSALTAFAEQSKMQVLYQYGAVKGVDANAVMGTLYTHLALAKLLEGTGLEAVFSSDTAVTIRAARKTSTLDAGSSTLAMSDPESANGADASPAKKTGWFERFRLAQNEPSSPSESSSSPDEKPSQSSNRNSAQQNLEEIVVTAQKRSERLQDVPISISVLSGADLDRSTAQGIAESLNTVPGVMAQESYIGGGTQVSIRGVGAASTILHGSSPIAYYLDSVPFGLIKTSVGPDSNAYDMARVEVLRGPQGTLYGASALNGVVRVLTQDADLNEFEFKGRTSGSSTDGGSGNYRGDAALNVPIVEGKLAARAVVGYESQSGWIDRPNEKDANDAQLRNYRLKLNAQPVDELSVGLSVWSSRSDYGAPSMGLDNGRYSITADEPMSTDYDAYGLKIGYDFPGISIASMTSYLDYNNSGILDLAPLGIPGIPFVNKYFAHIFSQEINLNSAPGGSWRWSVGGIYRDAKDRTFQTITGILPAPVDFNDTSKSFAFFGEVTRLFLDRRLELTAGLRYFSDDVGTNENTSSTGVPGAPLVDVGSKFHKTTPRVVLNWHPSDQVTAYASYAEGFRSGFQQQPQVITAAPQLLPVGADSLKNYELGAKGSVMGGRLAFDTALYYIDWQDVQSDNAIVLNGVPVAALVNGGSASGVGFDVSVSVKPVSRLELSLSFSTNNLAWDEAVLTPLTPGSVLFAKGDRLSLSPKYTAGASANYAFPLGGSGYEAGLSASASYNSAQYMKFTTGFGQADPILIARASFSISSPAHWTASLYGDNLNNEHGVIQQAPFPIPDWAVRPRPRTIGLQLEYHF